MPINLNSIAKTLRAEEKALEKRLGKIKKALVAFAGLSENSGPKKRRKKYVGGRTPRDRSRAKSSMGEGAGGEESLSPRTRSKMSPKTPSISPKSRLKSPMISS